MNETAHDAIIIGSGQAGNPLAHALAGAGRNTAIIERRHVGGTCINYGCTPTKTMVASARVAHLARRSDDYGIRTGPVSVDLAKVRERKRSIVESFRGGQHEGLTSTDNLELVNGHARFVDPTTVEVELADGAGRRRLTSRLIFIDTGARAVRPPIDGIDTVDPLDNESIMELAEVPSHLLVIGGGYVGLEFAQMFRRFGSEVTIVQRGNQLLSNEDEDVAAAMRTILEDDGIEVLTGATATSASRSGTTISVAVSGGSENRVLTGSHVLIAAGRRPNTDSLGLDAAGVEVDERGYITVDDRLETTAKGIYALGDVNGGPAFTHISYDDFRIVRDNLLNGANASTRGRLVCYTVFTDPELGRVGLTETAARESGHEIRLAKLEMSSVARALESDETRGFIKAVADAKTDRILGACVLGVSGGELMSVLQVAMMGNLPYTKLRDGIFAHPTLAEALNNLFGKLED